MKKKVSVKTVIILFVLAVIAVLAIFAVTLKITKITYIGNEKCTDKTMESYLITSKMDRNPLVFYFKSKFQEHPEIPFVEEYDVTIKSLHEFEIDVYEKSIIGYIKYMGQCMYFDKDGIVVEVTDQEVEGITIIEGIEFDYIVVNQPIPVEDKETFNTILDVSQLVDNYNISVNSIYINENLEITLYLDKIRVELGTDDEELSEKMNDLSSIISVLTDDIGVLNMKEYSSNDKGYTFKKE